MLAFTAGALALDVAGAALALVAVADMFLTIFNYDGYTTLASIFHRLWWRFVRLVTRPLPVRQRHVALSIGSASMLPATVALWLGLEITGFALLFDSSLGGGAFTLKGVTPSLGSAFYLSAGAISSLSFGDVVARGGADRALVDLETIVGLATFTLALGYVVTAFDLLGRLENVHGRVRRHARDLEQPESILARHFRGGSPANLPSFLQALSDDLESYDQGLRRYPVVYFFHTRRLRRSIPYVFTAIGELVALLRWGLGPTEPIARDPFLAALHDVYAQTLDRLRRTFVGPEPIRRPEPLDREAFVAALERRVTDAGVEGFRRLRQRAHDAAGRPLHETDPSSYEQYRQWLPFAHEHRVVLDRVADRLGYPRPESVRVGAR